MADDLNLFELDEDGLADLVPGQRSRAVSKAQAVELSQTITVGGRIDLSAEAEAEAASASGSLADSPQSEALSAVVSSKKRNKKKKRKG